DQQTLQNLVTLELVIRLRQGFVAIADRGTALAQRKHRPVLPSGGADEKPQRTTRHDHQRHQQPAGKADPAAAALSQFALTIHGETKRG
ncbi:MAG TPA: hypothetical protein PK867_20465, partial [Pirellulales bacterium]|nr:hypothetical protein [Pirellulales bacterium]